ncbi:hypothetical protein Tco_1495687, partial [Tanacetum coccineum]
AMGNLLGGRDVRVHVLFDSNAWSSLVISSTYLWFLKAFNVFGMVLVDFLIGGGGGGGGVGVDYGVLVVFVLLVDDGFKKCVGVLCG